ncbi:hypothetical protein CY34DRAFT_484672 [Suillus luteus UH-Slu-Lm8-n1]|uniref:Unplaced genomic scaffold CY34scaffold_354, whole genome shotgun sequence n=1 Tax=Suillus luteus UH-Slu-Lm8-n1 TaxID=930992 RepID=A0A0D0A5V9_9AGAM|nr:hypothetical protein CY34DRAFT_484672 [Suillus luteus UH-Slu-Lm8-n1]
MHWEHATNLDTGSSFELALGGLNGQAASEVHHPTLPLELPSIIQPIFPSISSSTAAAFPFSAPSSFVDGSATLFKIPSADRQVSHQSEYKIQSAHGHQVRQPSCPRTYTVDGLPIDEEDLIDGNTDNGLINVHACDREDHPCGLWVKADRRSIMRHGQRWHEDDRFGVDRIITCPWLGCNRQMRASGVPRHTLSAHFGVTWICNGPGCSKVFGRHDTFKAHAAKRGCLGATVKYDANTRVVDAKNVLSHYGCELFVCLLFLVADRNRAFARKRKDKENRAAGPLAFSVIISCLLSFFAFPFHTKALTSSRTHHDLIP